jgi:hypothetical protein
MPVCREKLGIALMLGLIKVAIEANISSDISKKLE